MAATIGELIAKLGIDGAAFASGIDSVVGLASRGVDAIGELVSSSVQIGVAFQDSMAQVATLTRDGGAHLNELKRTVESVAIDTGQNLTTVAAAMGVGVVAFGQGEEGAKKFAIALDYADTTGVDASESVRSLSREMKLFGDGTVESAKHLEDLNIVTRQLATMTSSELQGVMERIGPTFKTAGVGVEELHAAVVAFANATGSTRQAAGELDSFVQALINPSKELAAAFKSMGVESGQALIQEQGLAGAFQAIGEMSDLTGKSLQDLLGNQNAVNAAFLYGSGVGDEFTKALDAMNASSGALDEASKARNKSISESYESLIQTIDVFKSKLVEAFGPGTQDVLDALTQKMNQITEKIDWTKLEESITHIGEGIAKWIEGVDLDKFVTDLQTDFQNAIKAIDGLVNGDKTIAQAASELGKAAGKAFVDGMTDAIKGIWSAFSATGMSPEHQFRPPWEAGTSTPGTPFVPPWEIHGSGAITHGPELALIGEAGPEAVVPLSGNPFTNLASLLGVRAMASGGLAGAAFGNPSTGALTGVGGSDEPTSADLLRMFGEGDMYSAMDDLQEAMDKAAAAYELAATKAYDQANAAAELTFNTGELNEKTAYAAAGFKYDLGSAAGRDAAINQMGTGLLGSDVLGKMFSNLGPDVAKAFYDMARSNMTNAGGSFEAMNTAGMQGVFDVQKGILQQLDRMNALAGGMSEFDYMTQQANKGLNAMNAQMEAQNAISRALSGDFSGLAGHVKTASDTLSRAPMTIEPALVSLAQGLGAVGVGAAALGAGMGLGASAWGGKSTMEQAELLSRGGLGASLAGASGGMSGSILDNAMAQASRGGLSGALAGALGAINTGVSPWSNADIRGAWQSQQGGGIPPVIVQVDGHQLFGVMQAYGQQNGLNNLTGFGG